MLSKIHLMLSARPSRRRLAAAPRDEGARLEARARLMQFQNESRPRDWTAGIGYSRLASERVRPLPLFLRKTQLAEEPADGGRRLPDPHSIGETLRQRRAALGLDLDEVAAALKIKPGFLAALEEGRPAELPGRTYAVGFLRTYGDYLGLDSEEVLRRFKRETAGLEAKLDLSFPIPLRAGSMPGGRMVLTGLILALCGYGTWYYLSAGHRAAPQRVSEVPLALLRPPAAKPSLRPASALPKPAARAAAAKPPAVSSPPARSAQRTAAGAAGGPPPVAAPNGAAPPVPSKAMPTALALSAPLPQQAAAKPGSAIPRASRIVIRATAASWIEVRNADDAIVYSHVLMPGESYSVPDKPGLTLGTGNAGGLAITVGGRPAAILGAPGAIRRGIPLEPQTLLAGTALRR
jgi:cytoskeleton protein RodZ